MARLRIRVELNRGGVGVPLHKLASVVQEAQKFFQMLAEDVHIDTERGEWLAFDFDHESLNFTAEFVGAVSPEQVRAFTAAFDGTTSLRKATIAQFTRIATAIGEDELIGFGLYQSDQEGEPTEWRCLSRRTASRIFEEIQLLGAAAGLSDETHLPSIIDSGVGARLFRDRRDRRSLESEQSKFPRFVRDVEANLARRLDRLEGEVENHTHQIRDLRETSAATEESFRALLTSVENFCGQATKQLEKIAPPQIAAAAGAHTAAHTGPAPHTEATSAPPTQEATAAPPPVPPGPRTESAPAPAARPEPPLRTPPPARPEPVPSASSRVQPPPPAPRPSHTVRNFVIAAVLIAGAAIMTYVLWPSKTNESSARTQVPTNEPAAAPSVEAPSSSPAPAPPEADKPKSRPRRAAASSGDLMHVELEAREPSWVSVTDDDGKKMFVGMLQANESRTFDLNKGATVRTGNAGGLNVRLNGSDIGNLGPTGKIRDVHFASGAYQIVSPQKEPGSNN